MTPGLRVNLRDAEHYIAERRVFVSASLILRGGRIPIHPEHLSHLPRAAHASLRQAEYIVMSYDVPIAWWSSIAGWRVPALNYDKARITAHQKIVTAAIRSAKDAS